jgi:hypothetical protein
MAHIEYPRIVPNGVMFVVDAGIGYGHVVAGEFRHFCAQLDMFFCERRLFHPVNIGGEITSLNPSFRIVFYIKKRAGHLSGSLEITIETPVPLLYEYQ